MPHKQFKATSLNTDVLLMASQRIAERRGQESCEHRRHQHGNTYMASVDFTMYLCARRNWQSHFYLIAKRHQNVLQHICRMTEFANAFYRALQQGPLIILFMLLI